MKELIKKIIIWKLNLLAQMYLRRYKPTVVAVTGNVGKTTTKEAIAAVLSSIKNVRSGKGNLNNEFGVPLTILGNWADDYYEASNAFSFWCKVLCSSLVKYPFQKNYPEVLVLEYGADHPGDIEKLSRLFKPHVAVVTAIGDIPVHIEFFKDKQNLVEEKSNILKNLKETDWAILNHDDELVRPMWQKTKARTISYGFNESSNIRVSDFNVMSENEMPSGVTFKIGDKDSFVPVRIDGTLGKSVAWSCAAAAAVGTAMGMNLVQVSNSLTRFSPPKGRLRILKGIKNSWIIDDTYNASPKSSELALETLKNVSGKRKIAVLGDMLELGDYTEQAHKEIGNLAGSIANVLVCVGDKSKFIGESASSQISPENVFYFDTANDARFKVQELVEEGDIVLVKGSQGMRMERIVEEIMAEPLKKKDLLVRQSQKWLSIK